MANKKFMEKSVKHPEFHKKYKNSKHQFLSHDRVHYGSAFTSDLHKSLKQAKKRFNKPEVHLHSGGKINDASNYRIF
jgi:hypothetical protein